jgi:hypothetical protein
MKYFYFYQILTAFNKVKIMSEFVLLLLNIDRLQHGEDYVDIIFNLWEAVSIW